MVNILSIEWEAHDLNHGLDNDDGNDSDNGNNNNKLFGVQ